jgi:hypothetical protein
MESAHSISRVRLTLIGYWSGEDARDWPDVNHFVDASCDAGRRVAFHQALKRPRAI